MFVNVTLEARLRHVCRWQCIWTHHPKYPRGTSQTRCHFAVRKCPEAPGLGGDKTGSAPSEKTLREHCLRANRIPARTMSSMLCHPCACTVRACSSIGIAARPSRKAARLRRPVGLYAHRMRRGPKAQQRKDLASTDSTVNIPSGGRLHARHDGRLVLGPNSHY